jgi:hypothetical protein
MYPNKLMVWTINTAALCEGGGIREERNRTPLFGHLRRTSDRRNAMVKHKAIAHDYCIKAGISCQQQKKRAPDERGAHTKGVHGDYIPTTL